MLGAVGGFVVSLDKLLNSRVAGKMSSPNAYVTLL